MTMDVKTIEQIVADLLEANEQAFAILTAAVGDVVGHEELSAALDARLERAQVGVPSAARDMLLATAQRALRVK